MEISDLEDKYKKILEYCKGHTSEMWAASIVGILLDCDFRDSENYLMEYLQQRIKTGL
jgi:hypothetical protein